MNTTFLDTILPADFLQNYWNKKPLILKNVIANIEEFSSFDDFVEMSKDEYFETRMVYETGGEYPWQAKLGPFTDNDFKENSLWTLICHNLELINSDFFELKKKIRFIPEWNFDDLMVTVSKKGASVGAHIDDYSVFIIQGSGSRKWMLQDNANAEYIPNLDIKLLKEFHPKEEWILETGDMLYLPPGLAHHGVSLEDSISYSLGFKSIRYKELLDYHITQVLNIVDEASFHDSKITVQKDPFLIQDYVIENIYQDLMKFMADKETFKNSLLSYLSRPRNIIENTSDDSSSVILKDLKSGSEFKRDIWSKLVATRLNDLEVQVAINEKIYNISEASYQKLQNYFSQEADDVLKITKSESNNKEFTELMKNLINDGIFYFC